VGRFGAPDERLADAVKDRSPGCRCAPRDRCAEIAVDLPKQRLWRRRLDDVLARGCAELSAEYFWATMFVRGGLR
jgi:hypothetical protein